MADGADVPASQASTRCAGCGCGAGAAGWDWSRERDPRTGAVVVLCPTCTRENVRAIEARLERDWW